jgi:hypothetical protein
LGAIMNTSCEIGARLDEAEVDVEAVRQRHRRARLDVRRDLLGIELLLLLVRRQDHDHVRVLHRLGDALDREPGLLRLGRRRRTLAQADGDVHAAVLEVQRVRVALRAVADDRDLLSLDEERSASLS